MQTSPPTTEGDSDIFADEDFTRHAESAVRRPMWHAKNVNRYFKQLGGWWRDRRRPKAVTQFSAVQSVSEAPDKTAPGEVVLVGSEAQPKWLLVGCPCRCGETFWLNLMSTRYPHWEVMLSRKGISATPSVWSKTCGSHFWIRNGRFDWARFEPHKVEK